MLVFDDDHYYMGGVIAELAAESAQSVSLVTPSAYVSDWSRNTLDQGFIHVRLAEKGIDIVLNQAVSEIRQGQAVLQCIYTGQENERAVDSVILVTSRLSNDAVWQALNERQADWQSAGIQSVRVIGDAEAPAPIAWATYAGHRYARELDEADIGDALPFRREITELQN